ncbi:hypothetical protein H8M03_06850 [Sphingomonas sabuli]|uniref:DUF995 domain-containing protein n=1 Tax=Sphingomonas sabuli TaxID=2764186 RepID=A0A7G9KZI6_9SPHN|nr:hypothetical protein [Sphingomonas sabuli]QNM81785.1 hypothetical protein H8M03_06850 [Sphingomonas sabuli]
MITALFLLAAAAAPVTAVDAERAFEAEAHQIGQWAAFRKWSTADSVMFNPNAVWTHELLKDAKEPKEVLHWAPADSWVSCDKRTAVNRGPWYLSDGKATGFFTTVWMQQKEGWRWIYDGGDSLDTPIALPKSPRIHAASCTGKAKIPAAYRAEVKPTERIAGQAPADAGQGRSADGTLLYEWKVEAGGRRRMTAKLWNGADYATVLDEVIQAPPATPPKPQ